MNNPTLDVIRVYDSPETLFYLDPPHPHETRGKDRYPHEMTCQDHEDLAQAVSEIKGVALVSGYACELYDRLYAGWSWVSCKTYANNAFPRTEKLWISPRSEVQGRLEVNA